MELNFAAYERHAEVIQPNQLSRPQQPCCRSNSDSSSLDRPSLVPSNTFVTRYPTRFQLICGESRRGPHPPRDVRRRILERSYIDRSVNEILLARNFPCRYLHSGEICGGTSKADFSMSPYYAAILSAVYSVGAIARLLLPANVRRCLEKSIP